MIGVGTFKISDKARNYVNAVLNSERLSYGYFSQRFEREFAAAHDCRFAIMTNSGTSSLQIALAALKNKYDWADGDEVIIPAVTFIATSNIVVQNNMKPVFVDVDPIYYELDPALIERSITARTRCIIPVHLFGLPCDMEPIMEIARRHDLRVIEDSCETMFARHKGTSVGAFGDIGCFSTYVAHILTTGVGGLCTTNDPGLAIQLRSLMNHGRDSIYLNIDDDKNKSKAEMEMIIQRRFSFVQMGYSYRATEMEAALGLAEFEDASVMMLKRRENGRFFMERLKNLTDRLQLPTIRPEADHSFMMFPIVLKSEDKRNFVNYLEFNGIETRDMLPLTNQPYIKKSLGIKESEFPVAQWVNNNGLYIASHQGLSEIEREHIVKTIEDYFAKAAVKKNKSALILMSKNEYRSAQMIANALPVNTFDEMIFAEGSRDTEGPRIFEGKGFKTVRGPGGKGELLRRALQTTDCENIVVMGSDGADDPEDIQRLLIRLNQGYEMVIASRFMTGGGRHTHRPFSYRSIGNRFFSFLISTIFNENISDANNIFRGFKKNAMQDLALKETGEGALFEMTVKALGAHLKVSETPTTERPGISQRRQRRNRALSALAFLWLLILHFLESRFRKNDRVPSADFAPRPDGG